ncbi:MAG: site-specific integrase [Spirochaetia bacterium]
MQAKDGYHYRKRNLKSGVVFEVLIKGKWKSTGQTRIEAAQTWTKKSLSSTKESISFFEFTQNFYQPTSQYRLVQEDKGRNRTTSYWRQQQARLDNYLIPALGDLTMCEINTQTIENVLLTIRLAGNTKNKILYSLKTIFNEAIRQGILEKSPIDRIDPFNNNTQERQPFTPEEMTLFFPDDRELLLQIWGDLMWACYFCVLRDTGHRPGEQSVLLWSDLWQQEGRFGFIIDKSMDSTTKKARETTKTGYSRATLISANTYALLQEWRALSTFCEDDDLIFTLDGSRGIISETIAKHLRLSAPRAGVNLEGRTPYCFRHTFNTQLLLKLNPSQVRFLMGHRTEKETDNYNHPDRRLLIQKAVKI